MTKDEAARHLRALLSAIQKLRSVSAETSIVDHISASMWPWVYGDKNILPAIVKMLDQYDETGELSGMDFYNIVYIATQLEPMLAMSAVISEDVDFPEETKTEWIIGLL